MYSRVLLAALTFSFVVVNAAPGSAQCPERRNVPAWEKTIAESTAWLGRATSNEDRGKALNNRSNGYFSTGRPALAIKDREQERALTGKVMCQRCLAQAYIANGQYDLAIAQLDEASKRGMSLDNHCFRGMANYRKNDLAEAVRDFEKASSSTEDFRTCGLFGRGLAKLKSGDASGRVEMNEADAIDKRAKFPLDHKLFYCMHGITIP